MKLNENIYSLYYSKNILPKNVLSNNQPYENNKYLNLMNNCIHPEEAYRLKLNKDLVIEHNLSIPKKSIRRIFNVLNNEWLPFEKEELNSYYNYLKLNIFNNNNKKYNLNVDDFDLTTKLINNNKSYSNLLISEQLILRFLYATSFNHDKTSEYLVNYIQWHKDFFPFEFTDNIKKLLNIGFIYFFGRDKQLRQIFVIDASIYIKYEKKFTYDEWLKTLIFFIEFLIHNLTIPGQIENWLIICDLRNCSVLGLPSDLKRFMKVMQSNYRSRLKTIYLIGMGFFLKSLWNIVKNMLDPETNKKVKILGDKNFNEIFENISKCQIEKKFEGNNEDIKVKNFKNNFDTIFDLKCNDDKNISDRKKYEIFRNKVYKKVNKSTVVNISESLKHDNLQNDKTLFNYFNNILNIIDDDDYYNFNIDFEAFFPPKIPDNNLLNDIIDYDNKSCLEFYTNSEYIDLVINNKIITISPYYLRNVRELENKKITEIFNNNNNNTNTNSNKNENKLSIVKSSNIDANKNDNNIELKNNNTEDFKQIINQAFSNKNICIEQFSKLNKEILLNTKCIKHEVKCSIKTNHFDK